MSIGMLIVMIVTGIIFCFFGFKWNKVLISLTGACIGFMISSVILRTWITEEMLLYLVCCLIAVLVGLCSYKIYRLGIFILCAIGIGFLTYFYIPYEVWNWVLAVILGALGGYLGLTFTKYAVIVGTSFLGGFQIVQSCAAYFEFTESHSILIIGLAISICGIIYQVIANQKVELEQKN